MRLTRRILICLFITVGANSSASAQETDRAAVIERAKKEGEVVWYTSAGLQDSNPMGEAFHRGDKLERQRSRGQHIERAVLIVVVEDAVGGKQARKEKRHPQHAGRDA